MKFSLVALAAIAGIVHADLIFKDGEFICEGDAAGKNFCAGDSLKTNIIIRCTGTKGQPGNCNDNLAGIPPIGVKTFAPCWQTSNTTGDASCSFNGIVYPSDGSAPFPVPGWSTTSSSSSSSASTTPCSTEETTLKTITTTSCSVPLSTGGTTTPPVPTGTGGTTCHAPGCNPTHTPTYTTGLPTPTPTFNAAPANGVSGSLFAGVLAVAGALLM